MGSEYTQIANIARYRVGCGTLKQTSEVGAPSCNPYTQLQGIIFDILVSSAYDYGI